MHKIIKRMFLSFLSLLLILGLGMATSDMHVNASLTTQEEASEGNNFRQIYHEGYLYNTTGNPHYLLNALSSYIIFKSYGNTPSAYKPLSNYIMDLERNNKYSKQHGFKDAPTVSQPMLEPNVMKMMEENYPYNESSKPATNLSKARVSRNVRYQVRRVRRRIQSHRRTHRIRRIVHRHRLTWFKGISPVLQGNYTSYSYNHGHFGHGLRSHYRIHRNWMTVDPCINEPWILHRIYSKKIGYHKYLIHGSNWKSATDNFARSSLTMQRLGHRMYVHYYGGSYIERHYTSGAYYRS